MNSTITRTSDDVARDRIETAWRDYPLCSDCGRPMTIEAPGSRPSLPDGSLEEIVVPPRPEVGHATSSPLPLPHAGPGAKTASAGVAKLRERR